MRFLSRFLALGLCAGVFGCGGGKGGAGGHLNAGGSSFINPLMSKWTSEYDKAKGVKINYQSIGSGAGITQMTENTIDFGCSDSPMTEDQIAKAKEKGGDVVHIPLVMGGIVPAYNLAGVTEDLKFSGAVLADIYMGTVKKWNDKAIQDLNPGVALPDMGIVVVCRSDGSGSTYVWTEFLSKSSPKWKADHGSGTSVKWPVGVAQKGTEGVASHVARSPGSIGYVELIFALKNKIQFGSVKNKEGEFVKASLETVTAAADNSLAGIPDDLRYSITDAPGRNSYPISATTWAVVYANQPADKGKAVVEYLRWMTHEGQELTAAQEYARLPKSLIEKLEKKIDMIQVGK